jgi:DNA-binding GntR family transcriptional regulator
MLSTVSYLDHVPDDHRSGDPPYLQLAAALRAQIKSGDLRPGDALPSINRLAQETGYAKTTVQKAIQVLKDEGLVRGVHGWGVLVLDQPGS